MKFFNNPLLKIIITVAIIFIILRLIGNETIAGSIFMFPFCILPLFSGLDGLVNKRLHTKVNHQKPNKTKFNIEDIIVHCFTLLIGIIMCIVWLKTFMPYFYKNVN